MTGRIFIKLAPSIASASSEAEGLHTLSATNHANLFGRSYLELCRQGFEVMETI